jgi:flagellin-like protein
MERSKARMKKLANDQSAISEIVGALMLILIVVIAASSLAVFVSQQQKILQDNQLIKTEKAGELLLIPTIKTESDEKGVTNITLTISSLHQASSQIDQISINNHVVNLTILNASGIILVAPQQTLHINLNMSVLSLFYDKVEFKNDTAITVKLFTSLSNEFDYTFFAPTSIIAIVTESQWNSSAQNYTPYMILDGSGSDQPGDATIMKWDWIIHDDTHNLTSYEHGRKVRFDPVSLAGSNLNITLRTENTDGMIGMTNMRYYI